MQAPGRRSLHWLAFCALLGLGALAAQPLPDASIEWQPLRAATQPWRWWSAAFVHYSPLHLAANVGACAVVGAFGWAARLPVRWTAAFAVAWPLTHLALLAVPALARYGGLSGMLHAGVAITCIGLMWRERGSRRAIGAAVFVGMGVKLLIERPWQGPVQHLPEWDIGVAPIAHVAGAAAGIACALVVCATTPRGTIAP